MNQLKKSYLDQSNAVEELKPFLSNFMNVLFPLWLEPSLKKIDWSNQNSIYKSITDKLKQVNEYPLLVNCVNKILICLLHFLEHANKNNYFDRILQAKTFEQFLNIFNNVQNDIREAHGKLSKPSITTENIKEYIKEIKLPQYITFLGAQGAFNILDKQIGFKKNDSIKVLMYKLKIYSYRYIESYFDEVQDLNESSGLDLQTIELLKSFNKYDYLKLNDICALGLILYDEYEKINLEELIFLTPEQVPEEKQSSKADHINLVDSDSE